MKNSAIKQLIGLKLIKKCDYEKESTEWLNVLIENWLDVAITKSIETYYFLQAIEELKTIRERRAK